MKQEDSIVGLLQNFAYWWLAEHHRGVAVEVWPAVVDEDVLELRIHGLTKDFNHVITVAAICTEEIKARTTEEVLYMVGSRITKAVESLHEEGYGMMSLIDAVNRIKRK